MKVRHIQLEDFGPFRLTDVLVAPNEHASSNVTVFIGNNGAGKTTVLTALATALSWFVARVRNERGNGSVILESMVRNGAVASNILIGLGDQERDFFWTLNKVRAGRKSVQSSSLSELSKLADHYRTQLTLNENTSLPLIAFYPVERVVLDIPLKIREKHTFQQLDGYDNALSQGVDFRRFFEWFREREDSENELLVSTVPQQLELLMQQTENDELWAKLKALEISARDKQLTAVRRAIQCFMPEFKNLKVRRKPRLHMSVDKKGETLNVSQLSQGEKSLMALVGDIARRLAMMNPALDNPLHGEGIVLIDEVDMHLHPKWARSIIERLTSGHL